MKKRILLWSVCALICILYAINLKGLNTGTGFYLVWLALGVGFSFMGIAAKLELWGKLPLFVRRTVTILIAIGLSVFFITEGFVLSGFFEKGKENLSYIIVLGAQVYEDGPSPVLRYRLDKAVDYLTVNPDTMCIVSGGQGENEPFSEAKGMSDYLMKKGIEKDRIIMEDQSGNTISNIENSMQYIDCTRDRVGIVTNHFHVFRATGIAKKQGIEQVYGIPAGTTLLYLPNNMLREFFGVWKDTIFGNMVWFWH